MITNRGLLFFKILNRLNRKHLTSLYNRNIKRNISTTMIEQSPPSCGLLSILEKNPKRFERIKFLGKLFQTNNHELRIAGGAVRDILGGVEPQDIDFATTARPEESLAILNKHTDLVRIIVTAAGQKHGTVAVKFKEGPLDFKKIKLITSEQTIPDESKDSTTKTNPEYDDENPFEITTLRCDTFTDGRHAEVQFVNDWRTDAERRDLTINAMFLTLDDGKLIDYFDGQTDLKNGVVRFVGSAELRIKEDYLRILRFFRFWSRYGKNNYPDKATLNTIKDNLAGLDIISGERIWQELKKILSHMPCSSVVKLLLQLETFDYMGFTDLETKPTDYDSYTNQVTDDIDSVEVNIQNYMKNLSNSKESGDSRRQLSEKRLKELLPVILLTNAIRSQNMFLNAHKRLKFSNMEKDSILYILENRDKNITIKALKYQLATIHAPDRPLTLLRMKALLIYKGLIEMINEIEAWSVPSFPLAGHIVSQQVKRHKLPGSKIKELLDFLKNEWAESDYKLCEEDLQLKLQDKCDELLSQVNE